jgi:hypothetical protein
VTGPAFSGVWGKDYFDGLELSYDPLADDVQTVNRARQEASDGRKLRVSGRTVEPYVGFSPVCNSKDASTPFVFARAAKFVNAFLEENSEAFDELQAAIDEALEALSEEALGANGRALKTKRVKQWAFAYAEGHLFLPKRTPLAEKAHFDGGAGQLQMALSVASCRRLSCFDMRGPPHSFVLEPCSGTAYLSTTSAFEHSVYTAAKQYVSEAPASFEGDFPASYVTVQFRSDARPCRSPFPKQVTYGRFVLNSFWGGFLTGDLTIETQSFYRAFP